MKHTVSHPSNLESVRVEILISNKARVMLAVPKNQEVGKLEGFEWFEKSGFY